MKHPLRPLLIVGNWKMYKTLEDAIEYFKKFEPLVRGSGAKVYLAVPYTLITTLADLAKGTSVLIGAQNMNDAEEGAFTGEIAGKMVKDAGAQFVLIGHSERRRLFGESDAFLNRKVKRALSDGLQPIFCIGETQSERDQGLTEQVLKRQIAEGLKDMNGVDALAVAYEPVWAIGTSQPATPAMTCEAHSICREALHEHFGDEAERVPILYGGSVNPTNAPDFVSQPNVDGLLVGTASLSAESFAKIVQISENKILKTSAVSL